MIKNLKLKIKTLPFWSKQTLFFIFISTLFLFPTIRWFSHPGFFRVDDDIQTMRVLQMTKCLKDFQIPCRWVPDMGYGYGYPQFIYYAPLPYYLMALIHLLGPSIITTVKLYFALSIVLSFLSFYYLLRRFVSFYPAIFGSFIYTYAPYKITNIFNRGALGEFSVWIIIPLILAFIYDLSRRPKNPKTWGFLTLSLFALITTHNLSLILYAPLIGIWALYWLFTAKKPKLYLTNLVVSGLFSLLLSAWFWLPMLYYQNQVHIETMFWGYFNYLAHFLSIKEIFLTSFWDWGDSQLGTWDRMTLSLGIWASFFSFLSVTTAYLKNKPYKHLLGLLFFTLLTLLFLTHPKSTPIYQALPFLQKLQFPWRFLSPATLIAAFLSAFLLQSIKKNYRLIFFLVFTFIIMLNYGFWFRFEKWQNFTDTTKFSGKSWQQQQTISIFDYLPKSAQHPPTKASPQKPYFTKGQGRVINFTRRTNAWFINVQVTTPTATLEVPNFYYPGWIVVNNNQKIPFNHNNELGLINFNLSQGNHSLIVKMTKTPLFILADSLSVIGFIFFIYYLKNKIH